MTTESPRNVTRGKGTPLFHEYEPEYEMRCYSLNNGAWTVTEITKRDVALVGSEAEANVLIKKLKGDRP